MFLPNQNGIYECEDCDFRCDNFFDITTHCEIEFFWKVQMAGKFHFDMFELLRSINELIKEGCYDTAQEFIQGIALCYGNSFDGNVNIQAMFEEIITRKNTHKIIEGMEKMLENENNE